MVAVGRDNTMDYHYDLLGLSPSATPEEIRTAYKREALIHHPDRASGCAEMFQEVQRAYEVLTQVKAMAAEMRIGREVERTKHYKPKNAPTQPEVVSCGSCLRTLETADEMLRVGSMQVGDIIETHLGDFGVVMGLFDHDVYWVKNGAEVASKLASREALLDPGMGGMRWKLVKHMKGAQRPMSPDSSHSPTTGPGRHSATHSRPGMRSNSGVKPPVVRSSSVSMRKRKSAEPPASPCSYASRDAGSGSGNGNGNGFARSVSGMRFQRCASGAARDMSPSIRRFTATRGANRVSSDKGLKAEQKKGRVPLSEFRDTAPRSPGALHTHGGLFERKVFNTRLDLTGVERVESNAPKMKRAQTPRETRSSSMTFGSVKMTPRPRTPRNGKSTSSSSFDVHSNSNSSSFPAATRNHHPSNAPLPRSTRVARSASSSAAPRRATSQPPTPSAARRKGSMSSAGFPSRAERGLADDAHPPRAPKSTITAEAIPAPTPVRSNSRARLVKRGMTLRSCTPNTHVRLI